jgi:hypothetical protein
MGCEHETGLQEPHSNGRILNWRRNGGELLVQAIACGMRDPGAMLPQAAVRYAAATALWNAIRGDAANPNC